MSHNSKYYTKSLKTNPVKSKSIVGLFNTAGNKRKAGAVEGDDEVNITDDIENNEGENNDELIRVSNVDLFPQEVGERIKTYTDC